jgi:6-phosphogluconolactonase
MDDTLKTPPRTDIRIFPDLLALSRAAAREMVRIAGERSGEAGRCTIALAGGHTPRALYELLAADFCDRLEWPKIHLFWGDERYVPFDDSKSNFRMVCEALLDAVPIPRGNVHPMLTHFADPKQAAREYEKTLRQIFPGELSGFDLILLGTGVEGHTASLFPNSPALAEQERWVVAVRAPVEPALRLSLTLPVLNSAQNVFFLAAGKEKHEVIARFLQDPSAESAELPISLVRPVGQTVWFLDRGAAG